MEKLYEAEIAYDAFTAAGQRQVDNLVSNLNNAKTILETLIYGNYVKDEETRSQLQEMHTGVCSMLDDLPW